MTLTKFISFLLALTLIFSTVGVFAAEETTITEFYASEDTYIRSGVRWQTKNYGDASNMLFGTTYNRTAFLKFDLSGADLSLYKGALLDLNVKTLSSTGNIEVYSVSSEWSEDKLTAQNAPADYELAISYSLTQAGSATVAFNISSALERAKTEGRSTIALALKSNVECVNVASSENSDKTLRPKLTLTEEVAFVKGQRNFTLPEISQRKLKSELTNTFAKGHPYIFATKEKIEKIKEYAFGVDPVLTQQYANVKKRADEILTQDIFRFPENTDSQSYISDGMTTWKEAMNLGLAYLVEGNPQYAERAYKQAEYYCTQQSWGTYQMIDNSQVALCVAITYDWFYDWMSPQQRDVLVTGLRKNHVDPLSDLLKNPSKPEYRWSFHQSVLSPSNHGIIDCGFGFVAALAIADTDIDFMTDLMAMFAKRLEPAFSRWYPDSAWYEGIGYWSYAGPFTAQFMLALDSAFGHCFGYEDIDCIMSVADFPIYVQSDQGGFVWTDTLPDVDCLNPMIYSMGYLKKDVALQTFALNECVKPDSVDAFFVLNYDPEIIYDDAGFELSLDKLFRDTDIVTMRDTFDGTQSTWAAMAVQEIYEKIGMMSNGSLGFDALGEHWIMNHGKEKYWHGYWVLDGDGTRWDWYRTRAEANSCLVINPSHFGGQNMYTTDTIDTLVSGNGNAFAITDLSETYEGQVHNYKRGIMLACNRKSLVVQDEFVLTEPSEVYSFFNIYQAHIEICEDGKSAIVSKNNKKMKVTVECDKEFEFGKMKSEPLPTSPVPEYANSYNRDWQKLFIHFDNVESANIRVTFVPYLCEEELSAYYFGEFVPLSEWKTDDSIKQAPVLTDLKLNGKTIAGFHPADRCYNTDKAFEASDVTAVYDTSKYDMKYSFDESNSAAYILLTDKSDPNNMNSYSIAAPVVREPNFVDTTNMVQLPITNTVAPVPQSNNGIENMYDNDLSTRWSADGAGIVMNITLDKVREVGCIAFNHYEGSTGRVQYFDVHLSADGTTWEKFEMFESSGTTDDMEYYDLKNTKAKYVKIIYNNVSNGSWNSVLELKIFGK